MKRIAIALILVLMAGTAGAQTIFDIQTGLVPENTLVQVQNVTVTATRYNGIFVSEAPYGEYNSIWVYANADLGFVPGDIVSIQGEYYEYFGLSEIDVTAGLVQAVGSGPVPPPSVVPAGVLVDPATAEPWECCLITIPDQGTVNVPPPYDFGEWPVTYAEGDIIFDDFFYDDTTVMEGDCYDAVTGILYYSFGNFKMNPYADGIDFCPVATDQETFGGLKALYR
jgi:hypothetical protein